MEHEYSEAKVECFKVHSVWMGNVCDRLHLMGIPFFGMLFEANTILPKNWSTFSFDSRELLSTFRIIYHPAISSYRTYMIDVFCKK